MPRASCTLELRNHYLHILNHMTMVKNTFERMSLWASLYPRLVWGFPPSSAAWWAKASDFAQSATWDCFLQFPPCEPIMLPNLPAGELFTQGYGRRILCFAYFCCHKNSVNENSALCTAVAFPCHLFLEATFCSCRLHPFLNLLKDPRHTDKPGRCLSQNGFQGKSFFIEK